MDKHKTESVVSNNKKKQKRLGPAPIASFEDISDEVRQKVCIAVSSFSLYSCLFFFLFFKLFLYSIVQNFMYIVVSLN